MVLSQVTGNRGDNPKRERNDWFSQPRARTRKKMTPTESVTPTASEAPRYQLQSRRQRVGGNAGAKRRAI